MPQRRGLLYNAQIAPLVDQIIGICRANGIPMIASFYYARGKRDSFCTTLVAWEDRNHERFQRALKVIKPED